MLSTLKNTRQERHAYAMFGYQHHPTLTVQWTQHQSVNYLIKKLNTVTVLLIITAQPHYRLNSQKQIKVLSVLV